MLFRVSTAALVTFSLAASAARADGTRATCARLRAEARAEAVTLYAPRILVEAARAPAVVDAGDPVAFSDGLQARASLGWSTVDALRGRAVERIADAECARTIAADRAARAVTTGARFGELAAIRAEIAFHEQHLPEIDTLVAEVVERFEHQRATALEVDELRTRRAAFRTRLAAARRELGELEELERTAMPSPKLADLARDVRTTQLAVDRAHGDLRGLSAWRLDVRAGVAGGERADWFAVVELGYSLGQPFQARANRRAIAAREAELATDDRALPAQLDQVARAMQRSVHDLEAEIATLDTELAAERTERDRLAALQGDSAKQLASRFSLEILELDARRTYLSALATARRSLAGPTP